MEQVGAGSGVADGAEAMTETETGDDPNRLLHTLRKTLITEFRSQQPDLTLRQLAMLLVIYLTNERQTVRGLAAYLNVHKSAVCRALDRFREIDLAYREIDLRDTRSINAGRTARGAAMVERLGTAMVEAADGRGRALSEVPIKV